MLRPSALALLLTASAASADLIARFDEGAPKDRFTITNDGACPLPAMTVVLDLATAPAGLIFDVTGSGAGVSVYQPFELVAGAEVLRGVPEVLDGDAAIALDLSGLGTGQSVAFTIDVDDTGGSAPTIVSGSEIAGASLRAEMGGRSVSATFGPDAVARLGMAACLS
ncbi:aggregation factor core [Marimonas sp. MJW-29]|uniref:Aggregation factor core n=1 Tax=Sulfitobacter sediminis TaxID=3234186 RepID=A0ABV3RPU5_9RHOB